MAKKSQIKKAGRHTTLTTLAKIVVKALIACDTVRKVSPGIITPGLKTVRGKQRIKVTLPSSLETDSILVTVRGVRSMQEIRVYGTYPGMEACLKECAEEHNLLFTIS